MSKHQLALHILMPFTLILLLFTSWSVSAQAEEVDLLVEKIAPVTIGFDNTIEYIVRVTNIGDATATGVTLLDTLPADFVMTSLVPGAPTCQESGGVIACGLGTLEPDEFAYITVQGTISETTTTYDVSATNGAPFAVDSLTLTHVLPTGQTAISVNPTSPTCTISAQTVSCTFTSVEAAGTRTATVELAGGGDVIASNTATAAADQTESITANNDDSVNTTITNTPPGSQAPVMLSVLDRTDAEDDVISLQVLALDADGDGLTYGASNLPTGLSINTATGLISGTIATGAAGTYNASVTVSDGVNPVITSNFTWEVTADVIPTGCELVQEAEDATINGGMIVGSDASASGGAYVMGPSGYYNNISPTLNVTFCFYVETPGEYKLVGNVYGTADWQDSFYVEVDGGTRHTWDIVQNGTYDADDVNSRYTSQDPLLLNLTAGEHTVVVGPREGTTRLDKLALVSTSAEFPPSTMGIADVNVVMNAAPTDIDLYFSFNDEEDADEDLLYTVIANTNAALFSDVSIVGGTLTLTYATDTIGTADITVQAEDTSGLTVETTFTVTVVDPDSVNTAPTTLGLPDVTTTSNAPDTVVNLGDYFDDAQDLDADLTFAVVTNDNAALFDTVNISGTNLTLGYIDGTTGVANITISATDTGGLSTTASFVVTVIGTTPVETVRIMPVGDSITSGRWISATGDHYVSYRRDLWFMMQDAGYSVDFVGDRERGYGYSDFDMDMSGDGGWPAQWVLGNITNWMTTYDPDVVLLHIGTNDLLRAEGEANAISEIEQIISRIRNVKPNTVILLAQIFQLDYNGYTEDALNTQIATLAGLSTAESPVIIVDQATGVVLATDSYDNIHPNETGEAEMARRWFNALEPVLDSFSADTLVTTTDIVSSQGTAPIDESAHTEPIVPEVTVVPVTEVVVLEPTAEVTEEPVIEVTQEPIAIVTEEPATNQAPLVQVIAPQENQVGDVVELAILAHDPEGSAMRYATNWETGIETLPAGLSIDAATGVISGTVAEGVGTYNVLVTVIDGEGLQSSVTFTWTVTAGAEPQPEETEAPVETTPEVTEEPALEITPEVTEEAPVETTPEVTPVVPEVTQEPTVIVTPEAPVVTPEAPVVPEATEEPAAEVTPEAESSEQ